MPKKTKKIILPVRVKSPATNPIRYKKLSNGANRATELTEKKTEINAGGKITLIEKQNERKQAPAHIDSAKAEREKGLIMYTGITFFMILIISVWIFNMKSVFKSTKAKTGDNTAQAQLNEITDEFSKNMEQIKEGLKEIKSLEKNSSAQNETSLKDSAEKINPDEIEKLKEKLEELGNGAAMNKEQASSTDNIQSN
ncbi:hypothetical protein KJ586_04250 [Patescibacteria group bacterium]|nr:hypothetical protein [Patescibacteria group bacterium]MCG2691026.1 hypothetical protein [Candidatus Parcubacteria bacterium]